MNTKNILLLLAALVLFMMHSCSDEEYVTLSPSTGGGEYLTFTIPGVKTQLRSYASLAGSALENQVDSLDIYMFADSSEVLTKVFRPRNNDLKESGNGLTATIDITGRKGDHTFYFVANGKNNVSELENALVGITKEDDFREYLTSVNDSLIGTPLLMTAQHKVSAIESTDKSAGTSTNKVTLSRRVARFDVENDSSETNFTIEKILVQNVYRQGYAFGEATGTSAQTRERGNLDPINYKDSANANKAGLIEGVFYLYPTKIGAGETTISFEGEFMGQKRIYTLKTPMEIGANKRYVLKVRKVDETKPELEGIIVAWEDVAELYEARPGANNVIFSGITMTPNTGVTTTPPSTTGVVTEMTYDITDITKQTTLSFTVESEYAEGASPVVTVNTGDLPGFDVISEPAKLSYGARYIQPYKIIIPERTDKSKTVDILVEIVNQADPQQRLNITVHGDGLNDVKFSGITLAPTTTGVTETKAPVTTGLVTEAAYDITNITGQTTLSFTVESYKTESTEYTITGNDSDLPGFGVTTDEPVAIEGARYLQTYTITIPERTDKSKKVDIAVQIVNKVNREQYMTLNFKGDELKDVKFSGITLSPTTTGVRVTQAPVTTGLVTEAAYDITNITGQTTLSFTVESHYPESVNAVITGNKSDLPGFDVTAGQLVAAEGTRYVQPYTIVIPERTDDGKAKTINIKVEIVNQADPEQRLSINIKGDALYYPGTTLKPIVVGDVTWAPVNVGATEIGSSTALKHTGYYYQWGRNTGFVNGGESSDLYSSNGPVDETTATTGDAKGKFIRSATDWLSPSQDNLWSGAKSQGPCPEGWRVPTQAELDKLMTVYNGGYDKNGGKVTWDATNTRVVIKGDNGTDILYLPAVGNRNASRGSSYDYGANASFWSSSPDGTKASRLSFNSSSLYMNASNRATGYSVRCVQE